MTDAAKLRVGFVGAGWAATEHAASLAAIGATEIVGVTDRDGVRARAFAAGSGAQVYETWRELLEGAQPDALVIATPPGSRRDASVTALEAGIGVFLEKPVTRSLEDAIAIVDAQQLSGSVCAVGYQWRAAAAVAALRDAVSGASVALLVSVGIGITQARAWFADPTQSGGLVSERGSHHLDLQRAIAGDVARVRAIRGSVPISGVRLAGERVEDVVSLSLEFVSGALGAVHVAWTTADRPGSHRLTVVADDGGYELELDPIFELRGHRRREPIVASSPDAPFVAGLARFCDAVRAGDPAAVACSARDAAGSLATALACERALASGEAVEVETLPSLLSTPEELPR